VNSLISLNSRVCLYPELSVQHKKDLSAQDLSYILSEIIIQQSQFITVSAYHLSYILYKEDKKVYLICSILILIPNYIFKCRIKAFTWIRQFYYLINMAILEFSMTHKYNKSILGPSKCNLWFHVVISDYEKKFLNIEWVRVNNSIDIPYGGLFSRGANFRVPSKNAKINSAKLTFWSEVLSAIFRCRFYL
jgi:hypothetical protein